MAERHVLFRIGGSHFSVPFEAIDEILGIERIMKGEDVPPEAASDVKEGTFWVATRGRFVPLSTALPPIELEDKTQIIVVRSEGKGLAFSTDQVVGIERIKEIAPFPPSAAHFCDLPYAGVHIWKGRVFLELDLSRMISLE